MGYLSLPMDYLRTWAVSFRAWPCTCSLSVDWQLKHSLMNVMGQHFIFSFHCEQVASAEFQYLQAGPRGGSRSGGVPAGHLDHISAHFGRVGRPQQTAAEAAPRPQRCQRQAKAYEPMRESTQPRAQVVIALRTSATGSRASRAAG